MRYAMAVVAVVLFGGPGRAEEVKGTLKKVDAEKGTLTVTVTEKDKEKDRTFTVSKDTKVSVQVAAGVVEAKDGLKNAWFKRAVEAKGGGYRVEVTVTTKDKKEVVTKVLLFTPTRREGPPRGGR